MMMTVPIAFSVSMFTVVFLDWYGASIPTLRLVVNR